MSSTLKLDQVHRHKKMLSFDEEASTKK